LILIVDDEPVIRRVAQLALSGAGHAVVEAADSHSALETVRLASEPFDLVLLDLTLPDGDGMALIPHLRQYAPGIRILVVSGLGPPDASVSATDGFLPKPFTRATLLAAVDRVLRAPG
jgi:two-component system response regulator PilR (NtrC family)